MSYDALEEMSAFFSRRCSIYDTVHPATIDGGPESKQVPARWLPEGTFWTWGWGPGWSWRLCSGAFRTCG